MMDIPCFACGKSADPAGVRCIHLFGRVMMAEMPCCGSRGLFMVDPQMVCEVIWTDLEAQEVPKMIKRPPISVDDVLEAHVALEKGSIRVKAAQ